MPRSEPVVGQARLAGTTLLEISFAIPPHVDDAGITQAACTDGSDRHCNGPAPKHVFFRLRHSAFHSAWPDRIRSSLKGTGARMAWGGLCAQIDLQLGHRRLGNGWQYPSPHDHHRRAAAGRGFYEVGQVRMRDRDTHITRDMKFGSNGVEIAKFQ